MGPRILVAAVVGILVGVFAASFIPLGFAAAGFAALLCVSAFLVSFFDSHKRRPLIIMGIFLVSFSIGILRMNGAALSSDPALSSALNTEVTIEGVVFEEPDVRESSTRIFLHADVLIPPQSDSGHESEDTEKVRIDAGILAIAPPHSSVRYGDRVRAEGLLRVPEAFDTGSGRQFNYPAYLAKDSVLYELAFADVEVLSSGEGSLIKKSAIWIKQKFLEGIGSALPEPHAGLAGGITVGAKRGLGESLTDVFISVGLIHVVVLSGYNIMLVMNGAAWLFSRAPRLLRLFVGAFIAIFFALMTGGAASSVRAAAMAVIGVIGRATGRVYLASRALGIVALAMVLWNPFLLSFDPGFQLSVIATLGLIWFTPVVKPHLPWITERFALREIAASTIGTQIAVLPLLLYQNGLLPIYSFFANVLALVAIPPAMIASAIAAIGGLIAGPLAPVIAFPAYLLLAYITAVAEFFSSLPFASISIGQFSGFWLFLAYVLMFAIFIFIKKRPG
ncbi:MAG: ComEC/Rec2-related protein [Parcubacteria group bacterium GW2011_GWA2_51_10]|nr:MAG: ComEC/Rec2-related protein [Parcubacteria group bacterium GW2011_GWA2_51_10]